MVQLPFLVFVLGGTTLFALHGESHAEMPPVHANLSCTETQTQCEFGCCPFADAVCCLDGYECCQHGEVCIPYAGICVGIEQNNSEKILVSTKTTAVQNLTTPCPFGTTTCGPDKCCYHPHATCCEDGLHCCPHGYRCDMPNKQCVKSSENFVMDISEDQSTTYQVQPVVTKQYKTVTKKPYKSCPGGYRKCPSNTSCCLTDKGDWGCCPNPFLNFYDKESNDCCITMYGPMCCPDDYPVCTAFGCMKN